MKDNPSRTYIGTGFIIFLILFLIYLKYRKSNKNDEFTDSNHPRNILAQDGLNIVGFYNNHFTCYLNTILQLLFSVETFRDSIINSKSDGLLINQLKKIFKIMKEGKIAFYDPIEVINIINSRKIADKFKLDVFHDIEEFLIALFLLIDEEENKITGDMILPAHENKRYKIMDAFIIKYMEKYQFYGCNHSYDENASKYMETYLKTVNTKNFEINKADDVIPKCKICDLPSNYDIKIEILMFPKNFIAIIRNLDDYGVKIEKAINIKEIMEMHGKKYFLKGFVEYTGGVGCGHYTCYTLRGTKWYHFNDLVIRELSEIEFKIKKYNQDVVMLVFEMVKELL